jgi:hypothetical protein
MSVKSFGVLFDGTQKTDVTPISNAELARSQAGTKRQHPQSLTKEAMYNQNEIVRAGTGRRLFTEFDHASP